MIRKVLKGFTVFFAALVVLGVVQTASATGLDLTQQQKEEYHKQYIEIVNEVNAKEGSKISVVPIDKFKSEDWVEPEEFKRLAIENANLELVSIENVENVENEISKLGLTPLSGSVVSSTKMATFKSGSTTRYLYVTATFTTQYSPFNQRQLFSGLSSINGTVNPGSFVKSGHTPSLIDGSRTYIINLSGTYWLSGQDWPVSVDLTWYCNADGSVS